MVLMLPWCTLLLLGVWGYVQVDSRWPSSEDLQLGWLLSWAPAVCMLLAAAAAHRSLLRQREPAGHSPGWSAGAIPVALAWLSVAFQWAAFNDLFGKQLVGRLDVYSQPDLKYLNALSTHIQRLRSESQRWDNDQRGVLEQVERDLATWTARRVLQARELSEQLAALRVLAFDIYPRESERPAVERWVEAEQQRSAVELSANQLEQQRVGEQLAEQSAELERWLTAAARRRELAAAVTRLEVDLQTLKRTRQALVARQNCREALRLESGGLNARYSWLHLPVSVPGGLAWSSSYTGLVGLHTLYVMVGLLIVGGWQSGKATGSGETGESGREDESGRKGRFLRDYWTVTAVGVLIGQWFL